MLRAVKREAGDLSPRRGARTRRNEGPAREPGSSGCRTEAGVWQRRGLKFALPRRGETVGVLYPKRVFRRAADMRI